ncbi:MAG: hotdog fold thioesterase [Chitinophagaceae bacterium]|nr:hotdog fold thioesterase [Chitinophagaceae bacterium]
MIWKKPIDLQSLNDWHQNTMQQHIGIQFTEIGDDYIKATMPVDNRTKQPMGLLHGGASVALAESLGSVASVLCVDPEKQTVVGLEINANHIKTAKEGFVTGITKPIHLGRSTQVWEIRIYNEAEQLVCISRITNAILEHKKPAT